MGGRKNGCCTCMAHSACHSDQVGRASGRRGLGTLVRTHSCRSQGRKCRHFCRCRYRCSWLPRSPVGKAGGSVCPSSQPDTSTVHQQGHSHQSGHSRRHWHTRHQTVPLGREAGSGLRATLACRYRLQFGGCRFPHGHTGNWHCNGSPRCQGDRARSSYHAANLPCRCTCRRWESMQWHFRRSSGRNS